MKLALSVVKSNGGSWDEITEHGILKGLLAKSDTISFSQKNLESESRVVLFIKENDSDAPKMLSLSERLSKGVRKAVASGAKKSDILKSLIIMRVIENAEGVFFLIPEGKQAEGYSVSELLKGEPITLEALIA